MSQHHSFYFPHILRNYISKEESSNKVVPERLFQEAECCKIGCACQSHRGCGRTEQTSVPLSVCWLMQVNPCTSAVATALGGLVSLR